MKKPFKVIIALLIIILVLGVIRFLVPVAVIPEDAEIETIAVSGNGFGDDLTEAEASELGNYLKGMKMNRVLHFGAYDSGEYVVSVIYSSGSGTRSLSINALDIRSDVRRKGMGTLNYVIKSSELYDYLEGLRLQRD